MMSGTTMRGNDDLTYARAVYYTCRQCVKSVALESNISPAIFIEDCDKKKCALWPVRIYKK